MFPFNSGMLLRGSYVAGLVYSTLLSIKVIHGEFKAIVRSNDLNGRGKLILNKFKERLQ
jgi:hypothetical protein